MCPFIETIRIEDGKIYTTEYEYAYQNHKLVYYNGDWWAVSNSQVDFGYTGFVYYDDVCWYVDSIRMIQCFFFFQVEEVLYLRSRRLQEKNCRI